MLGITLDEGATKQRCQYGLFCGAAKLGLSEFPFLPADLAFAFESMTVRGLETHED
jgi:hypothetical protein